VTEAVVVAMLDDRSKTLHRCGDEHLVTACGIPLDEVTVGPFLAIHTRAVKLCPDCFEVAEVVAAPPIPRKIDRR
jgi:hypothetical protein